MACVPNMINFLAGLRCVLASLALFGGAALVGSIFPSPAYAVAPELIRDLALGQNEEKVKAITALVASGDPQALPVLQSLLAGEVQTVGETTVLRVKMASRRICRPAPKSSRFRNRAMTWCSTTGYGASLQPPSRRFSSRLRNGRCDSRPRGRCSATRTRTSCR
jgi:hypothetical protein